MEWSVISQFLTSTIRLTTPIMLAALCATIGERAGILNIGLEGMILIGASVAAIFSYYLNSAYLGILCAIVAGMVVGYVFAVFTVYFRGNQAVVGVGLNIFASGFTRLLLDIVWGNRGASPWLPSIKSIELPLISKIPFLGDVIGKLSPTVYLSFFLVLVLHYMLFRTRWGLRLRSVGENPLAAQTVGLNVYKIRFMALIIGGALCGLAGGYLSLDQLNVFTKEMSAGRGYLAYAANIFGQWNPAGVMISSLVFGSMEALQIRVQGGTFPSQFAQMIPYLVTVIAVTFNGKKAQGPAAVSIPFVQYKGKHKKKKHSARTSERVINV